MMITSVAAEARRHVFVVTEQTSFAYATAVAEALPALPGANPAQIETSDEPLMAFCAGIGQGFADIALTRAPLVGEARALCAAQGISLVEILLGVEGLQVLAGRQAPNFVVTPERLYWALAKDVPIGPQELLASNPNFTWRDIDQTLPEAPIAIFGPAPQNAAGRLVKELILLPGARRFESLRELERDQPAAFAGLAGGLRQDRGYQVWEQGAGLTDQLAAHPEAFFLTPLGERARQWGPVSALSVSGARPNTSALWEGTYPLAQPVRLYLKKAHLAFVPGLQAYMAEMLSAEALGPGGYLEALGLIAAAGERGAF